MCGTPPQAPQRVRRALPEHTIMAQQVHAARLDGNLRSDPFTRLLTQRTSRAEATWQGDL
jgi:hypothetical protein